MPCKRFLKRPRSAGLLNPAIPRDFIHTVPNPQLRTGSERLRPTRWETRGHGWGISAPSDGATRVTNDDDGYARTLPPRTMSPMTLVRTVSGDPRLTLDCMLHHRPVSPPRKWQSAGAYGPRQPCLWDPCPFAMPCTPPTDHFGSSAFFGNTAQRGNFACSKEGGHHGQGITSRGTTICGGRPAEKIPVNTSFTHSTHDDHHPTCHR